MKKYYFLTMVSCVFIWDIFFCSAANAGPGMNVQQFQQKVVSSALKNESKETYPSKKKKDNNIEWVSEPIIEKSKNTTKTDK